jgi:hypothetical protein
MKLAYGIKRWRDLREEDFLEHPAWTNLYEPEDIDALEQIGVPGQEILQEVRRRGGDPEDWAFPLPASGTEIPFMRLHRSIRATLSGGITLVGYLTSASVAVFHADRLYHFNRALKDLSLEQARLLSAALGGLAVMPLRIEIPTSGASFEFNI